MPELYSQDIEEPYSIDSLVLTAATIRHLWAEMAWVVRSREERRWTDFIFSFDIVVRMKPNIAFETDGWMDYTLLSQDFYWSTRRFCFGGWPGGDLDRGGASRRASSKSEERPDKRRGLTCQPTCCTGSRDMIQRRQEPLSIHQHGNKIVLVCALKTLLWEQGNNQDWDLQGSKPHFLRYQQGSPWYQASPRKCLRICPYNQKNDLGRVTEDTGNPLPSLQNSQWLAHTINSK